MDRKKYQLLGIFFYYILAALFIAWLKLGYSYGTLFFLAIPAFYVTSQNWSIFKKTFLFSLIISIPMVMVFDYIGTLSKAWLEIVSSGIRILGVVPIETFFWAFCVAYFSIAFYEYFFDKDKIKTVFSKNIKYLIFILITLVLIFGLVFIVDKEILVVNYFYTYFAIGVFVIPPLITIIKYPRLMQKIIYQGLYFLILSIIYEITALYSGQWTFPGQYVGFVQIFRFSFPLEEFLWLAFCVPSIIAIYEIFADDRE